MGSEDDGRVFTVLDRAPDSAAALLESVAQRLHDGSEGLSVFSSVLVIGHYRLQSPSTGQEFPQVAVAARLRKDRADEIERLAMRLREVAADLDRIASSVRQVPT